MYFTFLDYYEKYKNMAENHITAIKCTRFIRILSSLEVKTGSCSRKYGPGLFFYSFVKSSPQSASLQASSTNNRKSSIGRPCRPVTHVAGGGGGGGGSVARCDKGQQQDWPKPVR